MLVQGYGRLEGGWPIAVLSPEDHAAIAAGDDRLATSFGRPIPQVQIDLRPLPSSARHELRVRSPGISPSFADPDGWCGLGDLVTRDDRGYLHLAGRNDDMINTGYHVYPAEIASVLPRVPGVLDAQVFGVPDPVRGQRVAARVTIAQAGDEATVRAGIEREIGHALDLTPESVAAAHHLSSRSLYNLFQTHNELPAGAWIQQRRFDRIRADLRDPRQSDTSIAVIGRRHGVSNSAYLSRDYRRRFSVTPPRTDALAPDQPSATWVQGRPSCVCPRGS